MNALSSSSARRMILGTGLVVVGACAVVADRATAASAPQCTSEAVNPETQTVTCVLSASRAAQRLRFTATFLGSHDDTRASLSAKLDEATDVCVAGSKTSLFGEDGEVSLDCGVVIAGASTAASRRLTVTLSYHHAQYDHFRLATE